MEDKYGKKQNYCSEMGKYMVVVKWVNKWVNGQSKTKYYVSLFPSPKE